MADDPSSALEEIRDDLLRRHRRGYTSNPRRDYCYADNQDWPCDSARLLAAVEAVLALADTLEPQAPPGSALEEDRMWIAQKCAEMIREAISRELTGLR